MSNLAANNYLRTRVLTATPEQLQLMLYDGAIRFAEQARTPLIDHKFDQSHDLLTRAQRIVIELAGSLKHDVSPDLCGKLAALYTFIHRNLVQANTTHDLAALDDALRILKHQRETWSLLMADLGKSRAAAVASNMDFPEPEVRMEASISMQG